MRGDRFFALSQSKVKGRDLRRAPRSTQLLQEVVRRFHPHQVFIGEVVQRRPRIVHAAAGEPAQAE